MDIAVEKKWRSGQAQENQEDALGRGRKLENFLNITPRDVNVGPPFPIRSVQEVKLHHSKPRLRGREKSEICKRDRRHCRSTQ
jgi:hypothetical protein